MVVDVVCQGFPCAEFEGHLCNLALLVLIIALDAPPFALATTILGERTPLCS